eukprot:3827_1
MFYSHSTLLALFYLCIVRHLTLSAPFESITDPHRTQYIIAYITSQSSLSPVAFETSFDVFSHSLRSVVSEALPSLSTAFNLTRINLWCLPDNTMFASFYIRIDYTSLEPKGNDVLFPIINRINNDLFPQLLMDHIATTHTHSPLIHPDRFSFQMYDVSIAPNASFISSDCVSYLINKEGTVAPPLQIAAVVNHDDDDFVQFMFYGFTVHWKSFVIWSALCMLIGMSLCTACVCFHIDWMERKRRKRRKQQRKHERIRSRNSYFSDQTSSCIGSATDLTPIVMHEEDDEEDIVAIIRPCSTDTSRTCTATAISRRNSSRKALLMQKIKSNSVTIDSEQSRMIRQQHMERQRSCRGYDQLNRFDDDEDMELKQEELRSRRSICEADEDPNDDKIVTVHVHHHYNPNSAHSPMIHDEEKENYPDLPFEAHHHDYVAMNSPVSDHNIRHIMTLSHHAQKEPSKSQREGFSPFTVPTAQGVDKCTGHPPEDCVSDSELLYVPGPASDDTPGQSKTPRDLDIGISK